MSAQALLSLLTWPGRGGSHLRAGASDTSTRISAPSTQLRQAVQPPSLVMAPTGWWQLGLFMLFNPGARPAPLARLDAVRKDFATQLDGVVGDTDSDVHRLAERIASARSLRELWHLRMAVYTQVAIVLGQSEAEARLARLNRHFPARSPRSGFVPL